MIYRVLVAMAVVTALGGCGALDLRPLAAGLAGGACRSTGSCSVVCGDGSTLDGRPAAARCRP